MTKSDSKHYVWCRLRDFASGVWDKTTDQSAVVSGRVVEEKESLMELGVRPHGSTRLEMSSTDPTAHQLHPIRPPEQDNVPDVITVRIQTGKNTFLIKWIREVKRLMFVLKNWKNKHDDYKIILNIN